MAEKNLDFDRVIDSREATSQVRSGSHLATAARVTYPAALLRILLDAPLLAAGLLTIKKWDYGWIGEQCLVKRVKDLNGLM